MISSSTYMSPEVVNTNVQTLDKIKLEGSNKAQLKKVSQEFEAVFVAKMLTLMDQTVDRENSIFGDENKYMNTFKSLIFNEMARDIAKNPKSTFGFAKQMYEQMEKSLPPDKENAVENTPVQKKYINVVDKEI